MNEDIFTEIKAISETAQENFGELSPEQINWRPDDDSWGVGQCFEHLIKSNELFYGKLDEIAGGKQRHSFLKKFSPLSGFFGNLLTNSLQKDGRKFKAPTEKIVPPSEIDPNIIELFAAHQSELIAKIKKIETSNWSKIKVTSPFMKFMTYRLSDGFNIVIEHEKRHLRQAERVTKNDGFPK